MSDKAYMLRMFQRGEDEERLHQALRDPRVVRHMATQGITQQDCLQIVDEALKQWVKFGYGSWAVVDRQSGEVLGWAGFKKWKAEEVELLCVLNPKAWGLGKSILDELIEYARQEMKLEHIYVLLPQTRKSYRAIQQLGFVSCGSEMFNNEPFEKFVLRLR